MKHTKTRSKRTQNQRKNPTKRPRQNAAIQHAYISTNFAVLGVAQLTLLGKRPTGGAIGFFHIDLRGVGIIDCFARTQLTAADYAIGLHETETHPEMMAISPDDARKILLACLGYSKELGQGPVHPEEMAGIFIDDIGTLMRTKSTPKTAIDKTISKLLTWSEATPPSGFEPGPHLSAEQRFDAHVKMKLQDHVANISHTIGEIERLAGRKALKPLLEGFLARADRGPSFFTESCGAAGMLQ